jgi:hypothetical protein
MPREQRHPTDVAVVHMSMLPSAWKIRTTAHLNQAKHGWQKGHEVGRVMEVRFCSGWVTTNFQMVFSEPRPHLVFTSSQKSHESLQLMWMMETLNFSFYCSEWCSGAPDPGMNDIWACSSCLRYGSNLLVMMVLKTITCIESLLWVRSR